MNLLELVTQFTTKGADDVNAAMTTLEAKATSVDSALNLIKNSLVAAFVIEGITKVVDAMGDVINEGAQAQANINQLRTTVINSGQDWKTWQSAIEGQSAALSKVTAYSDDEAIQAFTRLAQITGNVGVAFKDQEQVLNLATFAHVSVTEAATMYGKALEGNTRIFKQFGITQGDATQKLDELNARISGAAQAELNSYAGQVKAAGNNWKEFEETLGNVIIGNDAVKGSVSGTGGVFQLLTSYVLQNKAAISEWVSEALHMAAMLAPLVAGALAFVAAFTLISTLLPIVTVAIGALTAAIGYLSVFGLEALTLVALNPVTLGLAAVAAVVGLLAYTFAKAKIEAIEFAAQLQSMSDKQLSDRLNDINEKLKTAKGPTTYETQGGYVSVEDPETEKLKKQKQAILENAQVRGQAWVEQHQQMADVANAMADQLAKWNQQTTAVKDQQAELIKAAGLLSQMATQGGLTNDQQKLAVSVYAQLEAALNTAKPARMSEIDYLEKKLALQKAINEESTKVFHFSNANPQLQEIQPGPTETVPGLSKSDISQYLFSHGAKKLTNEQEEDLKNREELIKQGNRRLASAIQQGGTVLGDAVQSAFTKAFQGGSLGSIFKSFGTAVLQGIGGIFSQMGDTYLQYGILMEGLAKLLPNPFTAGFAGVAIGLALKAMAGALGAIGNGGSGGSPSFSAPNPNQHSDSFTSTTFDPLDTSRLSGTQSTKASPIIVLGANSPQGQRAFAQFQTAAAGRNL